MVIWHETPAVLDDVIGRSCKLFGCFQSHRFLFSFHIIHKNYDDGHYARLNHSSLIYGNHELIVAFTPGKEGQCLHECNPWLHFRVGHSSCKTASVCGIRLPFERGRACAR